MKEYDREYLETLSFNKLLELYKKYSSRVEKNASLYDAYVFEAIQDEVGRRLFYGGTKKKIKEKE